MIVVYYYTCFTLSVIQVSPLGPKEENILCKLLLRNKLQEYENTIIVYKEYLDTSDNFSPNFGIN